MPSPIRLALWSGAGVRNAHSRIPAPTSIPVGCAASGPRTKPPRVDLRMPAPPSRLGVRLAQPVPAGQDQDGTAGPAAGSGSCPLEPSRHERGLADCADSGGYLDRMVL